MTKPKESEFPAVSMVYNIFAIPYNFLLGFIVGVFAPVAAVAAMVAGVRLVTGKVPFLGHTYEDEGGRHLSFKLVAPEQAQELFTEHKERIGDDLSRMQAEIKAILEEARSQAREEE
jgi:16S rRNA C1402 (ribose-2'-O) methylase RsmI